MAKFGIIISFVLALFAATPGFAEEDTPPTLDGARILTADELHAMIGQADLTIYDLRKKASFVEGRVPSAVSIARAYDASQEKLDTSILGSDKSAPMVFYSHGAAGWKSYWAAKAAVDAGYDNVMWFRGGYFEWEQKTLPVER